MQSSGNLFADVAPRLDNEQVVTLAEAPGAVVERIVSTGQASPPGFWYDLDWPEWVILLAGQASLSIEGEAQPRTLKARDWLKLPAHRRHRVEWTQSHPPTVWLAVHWRDRVATRAAAAGDPGQS